MKFQAPKGYFYKLLFSFLFIGILPLIILGPTAYILSRNILLERTIQQTEQSVWIVSSQMESLLQGYVSLMQTLESEELFAPLYSMEKQRSSNISEEQKAIMYDALYLLLSGQTVKPGIHILDGDGVVQLNTTDTPDEYYLPHYRSWGVLHKALVAKGDPVLYAHSPFQEDGRIFTLALAKFSHSGVVEGYILVDLYQEHFQQTLGKMLEHDYPLISILDSLGDATLNLSSVIPSSALQYHWRYPERTGMYTKEQGQKPSCIFSSFSQENFGYTILGYYPLQQIDEILHLLAITLIGLGSVIAMISVIVAFRVSKNASKPLLEVVETLQLVSAGDFTARTAIDRPDEFGQLGESVNAMVSRMQHLIETVRQKEVSLRTAEIKSLQAQTKPHFIFNCLETIKWYVMLGQYNDATETLVELGALLRSTLDLAEGTVTLDKEISIVKHYLALQKRRLGPRLTVVIEVEEESENVLIPRFLLQPIVENAILHGLEMKKNGGNILIKAFFDQGYLHLIVQDDGLGMAEELAHTLLEYREIHDVQEHGSGIQNMIRRLKLYYGSHASCTIVSKPQEGTIVTILIAQEGIL